MFGEVTAEEIIAVDEGLTLFLGLGDKRSGAALQ